MNMAIWGVGLWFLFKETSWHRENTGDMQTFDEPHAAPSAPAAGSYQAPDPNAAPTY